MYIEQKTLNQRAKIIYFPCKHFLFTSRQQNNNTLKQNPVTSPFFQFVAYIAWDGWKCTGEAREGSLSEFAGQKVLSLQISYAQRMLGSLTTQSSNIQIKHSKLRTIRPKERKTTKYSVETKQSLLHLLREPPNSKHAIAFLTSSLP